MRVASVIRPAGLHRGDMTLLFPSHGLGGGLGRGLGVV